jgi:hypothetical protein
MISLECLNLPSLDSAITVRANELWDNGYDLLKSFVISHKTPFGTCSCTYCRLSFRKYYMKRRLQRSDTFKGVDEALYLENNIKEIRRLQLESKKM